MPALLVFDTTGALDFAGLTLLDSGGRLEPVVCGDGRALLERLVEQRPAIVLYVFRSRSPEDLGLLQLVRRARPHAPLILVADHGSLATQRLVQRWRPTYYAVSPLDPAELSDVLRAGLNHPGLAPTAKPRRPSSTSASDRTA